jgi:hypothetical protein
LSSLACNSGGNVGLVVVCWLVPAEADVDSVGDEPAVAVGPLLALGVIGCGLKPGITWAGRDGSKPGIKWASRDGLDGELA